MAIQNKLIPRAHRSNQSQPFLYLFSKQLAR